MTKIKIHFFLILLLLCGFVGTMYAQESMITGIVRSQSDGETLIGVSVIVKESKSGTITDSNGQFTLKANQKATLVFSYVGFVSKEIVVKGNAPLNIQLTEVAKNLDEVIVVGYGVQKKVNLTGAISSIDGKTIANKTSQNVLGALQGELPGLSVTRSSGQPGSQGYGIRIRGFSSVDANGNSNANALVLIDGIEGDMTLLNPNDIESVSVLKDAAAASIYGARAAAGVILVTTKNGKEGKVQLSYQGYFGVNTPGNMPERLPSWEEQDMINQSRVNQSGSPEWNAEMTEWTANPNFNYRINNTNSRWDLFTNTDWIKAGTNKYTTQQSHSVSASGGNKELNYLISGNYFTQKGLLKYGPDKNDRYNFRIKLNSQLNKYMFLEAMGNYEGNFIQQNPYGVTSSNPSGAGNILDRLYRIRTRQPIFNPTEDINADRYNGDLQVNPIDLMINGGIDKNQYEAYIGKASLTIKDLVKGLKVNLSASRVNDYYTQEVDRRYLVWYDRTGTGVRFDANNPNSMTRTKNGSLHDVLQATVDYDLKLNNHAFHFLAGSSYENYRKDQMSGTVKNLNSNDFFSFNYYDVTVVTNTAVSDAIEPWAMSSYFGRINYNYKDRYLLEGNLRYDGSSRLAPGYRWKAYPSFSAGWRVSQESFFDVPVISNLKIRGSWGQLGNGTAFGLYDYLSLIQSGNQMGQSYYYQSALASNQKTWETVQTTDVGFDLGMFNNRLSMTGDYYWKFNKALLATPGAPSILGLTVPQQNLGELKTWGWEFEVKWNDKVGNVNYSVAFNLADNQNKLIKYLNFNTVYAGTVPLVEGYPINSIWGYKTDGYWSSKDEYTQYKTDHPGYQTFSDALISGGDVKYVAQGANDHLIGAGKGTPQSPGDLVYLGTTNGRYLYGLNLSASWHGFDMSVFFQGVGQRSFLVSTETLAPFYSTANMPWTIDRDYWTSTNTNSFWPRLYNYSGNDFNFKSSDKYVQNGAYIRLKNIQVGYNVPLKSGIIDKMRFYVAGTDVWEYSTVLSVYDPEVGNNTGSNSYPFFRTWAMGVNITF